MKINSDNLKMIRLILSFNTRDYIDGASKALKYKVSYMEYELKLNDYKYQNIDFSNKTIKEIVNVLDSSMKINLSNVKYFDTKYMEVREFGDEIEYPIDADISLWLKERRQENNTIKTALKESFKRTLFALLIIIVVTILIIIIRNI